MENSKERLFTAKIRRNYAAALLSFALVGCGELPQDSVSVDFEAHSESVIEQAQEFNVAAQRAHKEQAAQFYAHNCPGGTGLSVETKRGYRLGGGRIESGVRFRMTQTASIDEGWVVSALRTQISTEEQAITYCVNVSDKSGILTYAVPDTLISGQVKVVDCFELSAEEREAYSQNLNVPVQAQC